MARNIGLRHIGRLKNRASLFMYRQHMVRNKNGFTLLEIMIAITILSFIMGIVYSSFSAISESDRRISLASESALKARNFFGLMSREISSIFVPSEPAGAGEKEDRLNYGLICTKEGDLQRIDFTAALSDSGSMSDVALKEFGYYLVSTGAGEGGGHSLFKRIDATPDDDIAAGGVDYFLMDGVSSLRYEFMKNEDELLDEVDASDKASLPKAIRVEISLINAELDIETFSTTISPYLAKTF
ncbi:MAG: prepilin-type N-terminal cleavage/methylation domain-containing protein [bacterium]|nr:prepilin-type N-terminal cleavage/methylation domain-containing protein [bacterium]